MESEVGIFYLELESDIFLSNNSSLSKLDSEDDSEELSILDEIKKIVDKRKELIIKFNTEYLQFRIDFIIKKYPIYSKILKHISESEGSKDQYEISFTFNDNIIVIEIINDEIVENCFKNIISLSEFYDFCHIIQDIAIFITVD